MHRTRSESGGSGGRRVGWLPLGLAVGLLLAPTAAVAAGIGLTTIVGPSGSKASVSKAGQLETSPADLVNVRMYGAVTLTSTCQRLATPPKGYSLVLTEVFVSVTSVPTPGPNAEAAWGVGPSSSAGSNCTAVTPTGQVPAAIAGETTVPYDPGFVIPYGKSFWTAAFNITGYEFAMGYLVPSSAAPKQTPITAKGGLLP